MMYQYVDQDNRIVAKFDEDEVSRVSCSVEDAEYLAWLAEGNTPEPYAVPPAPVPTSLTMKQARRALLRAGLIDAVVPALAAIPDAIERRDAMIVWEFANSVERTDPMVVMLAAAFELDEAALDALFIAGAAL